MSALEGTQPQLRHTPPTSSFSTQTTFCFNWPRRMAHPYPPGPAPMTTASHVFVVGMGGDVAPPRGSWNRRAECAPACNRVRFVSMKTRHACFFALGAAWCGGSVMLACSSSSPSMMGSPDAAMDTTTERSMFDALQPDGRTTLPDGTNTDSHPGDGGIGDGGGVDTGIVGNCSPVNGPACDIVKQNCPSGHECVVVLDKD